MPGKIADGTPRDDADRAEEHPGWPGRDGITPAGRTPPRPRPRDASDVTAEGVIDVAAAGWSQAEHIPETLGRRYRLLDRLGRAGWARSFARWIG